MDRKALFFDIDGTLFSEIDRQVPLSAALALKKARERGHLVFINTGRTFCQTKDIREAVEADGYLCGCGTYILAKGKILYDRKIPRERGIRIKEDIVRYDLDGVLEGVKHCYVQKHESRFAQVRRIKRFLEEEEAGSPLGWEDHTYDFSKFCVMADDRSRKEAFFETLPEFGVIDRGGGFYECVPEGHSKATAIELILERYGMKKEDAWVFGDSMNDLTMFQYAQNAVLMGRHDAGLEPYATFTTKTVEEDGIAWALEELGMIGA